MAEASFGVYLALAIYTVAARGDTWLRDSVPTQTVTEGAPAAEAAIKSRLRLEQIQIVLNIKLKYRLLLATSAIILRGHAKQSSACP